jgi:hypothetical protein
VFPDDQFDLTVFPLLDPVRVIVGSWCFTVVSNAVKQKGAHLDNPEDSDPFTK